MKDAAVQTEGEGHQSIGTSIKAGFVKRKDRNRLKSSGLNQRKKLEEIAESIEDVEEAKEVEEFVEREEKVNCENGKLDESVESDGPPSAKKSSRQIPKIVITSEETRMNTNQGGSEAKQKEPGLELQEVAGEWEGNGVEAADANGQEEATGNMQGEESPPHERRVGDELESTWSSGQPPRDDDGADNDAKRVKDVDEEKNREVESPHSVKANDRPNDLSGTAV